MFFCAFVLMINLMMLSMRSFFVAPPDWQYEDLDIYPIFQGKLLRSTILKILDIYSGLFFSQMSILLFGFVALMISMLEGCIIQAWLP